MTTGERIRKRREELGLTQTDLAIRMGYKSRAAICNVEKDKEDLTTTRIRKFADALDCSPAYLMGWEAQIKEIQKQLEPITKQISERLSPQMSKLAKVISESFGYSTEDASAYQDLEEFIEEVSTKYDKKEIERALKFIKAFLKATPEQQKIALEILQLHQEDS